MPRDEIDAYYAGWFKTPKGIEWDFDRSPISESALLARLIELGKSADSLTVEDLAHTQLVTPLTYAQSAEGDHDHWGGVQATEDLAHLIDVRSGHRILDVGCGLGGPARYLAWKFGCHVTGLDLTASRIESARRLTDAVGLSELVKFHEGNALKLPYEDASFDVVWGQSAWWLIPRRDQFLKEAYRVLRPGSVIAFEDRLIDDVRGEMARQANIYEGAWSREAYRAALWQAGFTIEHEEDWSHLLFPTLKAAVCQWAEHVEQQVREFGLHRALYQLIREAQKLALVADNAVGLGVFIARK